MHLSSTEPLQSRNKHSGQSEAPPSSALEIVGVSTSEVLWEPKNLLDLLSKGGGASEGVPLEWTDSPYPSRSCSVSLWWIRPADLMS